MNFNDYAKIKALSASTLKQLKRSVAHGVEASKYDGEPTEALIMGNAFHSYLLEPHKYKINYGQLTKKLDKRKKAHRRLYEYAVKKYGNQAILNPKQVEQIKTWKDSVLSNKAAVAILKTVTKAEHTITWDESGVKCKARLDGYSPQLEAVIDVKTCLNASPEAFKAQIYNYGYYLQAAHYISAALADGLKANKFIFIAVEKEAPYCTAVYSLDLQSLNAGGFERDELLAIWREYEETKLISGYSNQVENINLPLWALNKIEGKDE